MNPQLEQRIANRVRVEVAKIVQHGQEPDPEPIQYGHYLGADYSLDSLDRKELATVLEYRLGLVSGRMERACERLNATVGHVIEAAKRAYAAQWGEKEVV